MPKLNYLNVDLEILSKREQAALMAELGKNLCVLYHGPVPRGHLITLEVCGHPRDVDATIRMLCKHIENLSPSARRLWKAARERRFDVGFEVAAANEIARVAVAPDTIRRLSALRATLVCTLYPAMRRRVQRTTEPTRTGTGRTDRQGPGRR